MKDEAKLALEAIKARRMAELDRGFAEFHRRFAELKIIAEELGLVLDVAPREGSASQRLTVGDLAERYRVDERSPYQMVRPASRKQYDKMIKQLLKDCGGTKVSGLDAQKIQNLYNDWAKGGKIAMSHGLITMLRGLARFGMDKLGDADSKNLAVVLHGMYFPTVKSRTATLTAEHAEAIRAKAHEMGMPSIALAQAFQFDCDLRQKDLIGEWVPIGETAPSDFIRGRLKWVSGIRWNQIGDDLILRHTPSAGGDEVVINLNECRMVMAELRRLGNRPAGGPLIVDERTKQPYVENTFRWTWRKVADAAGIPKELRNADSRRRSNNWRRKATERKVFGPQGSHSLK
jgi:hypothetical protein